MSRLPDEYEALGAQLRAAAARQAATVGVQRRLGRWLGRHTLAAALLGITATGTVATAAVVSLKGEASKPLAGTLVRAGRTETHYAVGLVPWDRVGQPGWCTLAALRGSAIAVGGTGCGPAATAERHLIAGGGLSGRRGRVAFGVVDERVAAVRFIRGNRVVRTAQDPAALPAGRRFYVDASPVDGSRELDEPELLDAAGRVVRMTRRQERDDVIARQAHRAVLGPMPSTSPCRLVFSAAASKATGSPRSVTLLEPPAPTPRLNGRALLACGRTEFWVGKGKLVATVTVFVDAARPGSTPQPVPGARTLDGGDGLLELRPFGLSAHGGYVRRVGSSWVVAKATRRSAVARRLIEDVRVEHLPG